jgi:hypothetical protein
VIVRAKAALAALAAGLLAACATPEKVAFNPNAAASIETVTIVVAPEPKKYTVLNLAHPGLLFGAIGAAIAEADRANKESKFSKLAQAENFAVAMALARASEQKLLAAGYKVNVAQAHWEEKDGKYVLQPDKIPAEAGHVLVIVPSMVGYVASGAHYEPTIHAEASLLAKDRKTVLYKGYHSTGWRPAGDAWRHTRLEPKFKDFDALMAQPTQSAAALHLSADAISSSIAEDLRQR